MPGGLCVSAPSNGGWPGATGWGRKPINWMSGNCASVRSERPQKSGKVHVRVEPTVRLEPVGKVLHLPFE